MRVLIVPASKHGGTAEIGRSIAETLRKHRIDVDVSQPEHMFDLSPYTAHIVGSGLYMGNWLASATAFVDEHGEALQRHPTWLFSSGPLGAAKPQEPVRAEVVEQLIAASGAREHRLFSGRMTMDHLNRTERFVAKWVGVKDGDYREWDEIDAWVESIVKVLKSPSDRAIDGIGRAVR